MRVGTQPGTTCLSMTITLGGFAATLDHIKEGFQLIGFDWKYLYVNDAVVKQSKYASKQDLLGHTMMEKYPGIENTPLFARLEECMRERKSCAIENEFVYPDGSSGWFELKIEPVPEGIFILSTDVSERVRVDRAKQIHISKLEDMLHMTSHRVRQPVTQILGITNLLDRTTPNAGELEKISDGIKSAASSLDYFTRELTAFIHDVKVKYSRSPDTQQNGAA